MTTTAYVAIFDTMADWEVGHLMVELRTGRFTQQPWTVLTVGPTDEPITTMGGLRIVPDLALDDLSPVAGELLVLPGGEFWEAGPSELSARLTDRARTFLDAGVPVAAICGATAGLARAGLLDDRHHTGGAAEAPAYVPGYRGAELYVDARAVADRGLITAGPQSPVQFARAVLDHLGLASPQTLEAYEKVFHAGDPTGYEVLMRARGA